MRPNNKNAIRYAQDAHQQLLSTCQPLLENFPINGFVYVDYLNPMAYLHLATDLRWSKHYLSQERYGETWTNIRNSATRCEKTSAMIWTIIDSKDPIEQYAASLGMRFGMNVYQVLPDKIRLWSFTGKDVNSLLFFQTQGKLLQQFIHHFNHQCQNLITSERAHQNAAQWVQPIDFYGKEDQSPFPSCSLFPKSPVSLVYNNLSVILTSRQWEILKCYGMGLSLKDSARLLNISPRTVENILDTVRKKIGNLTKQQIRHLINQNEFG